MAVSSLRGNRHAVVQIRNHFSCCQKNLRAFSALVESPTGQQRLHHNLTVWLPQLGGDYPLLGHYFGVFLSFGSQHMGASSVHPSPAAGDVNTGGGGSTALASIEGVSTNKNMSYTVLTGTLAGQSALGWYLMSKPKKTEEAVDSPRRGWAPPLPSSTEIGSSLPPCASSLIRAGRRLPPGCSWRALQVIEIGGNFANHWASLRAGPIISKMTAKVDGTSGAFCEFAHNVATMAVVMSDLGCNLHRGLGPQPHEGEETDGWCKSELAVCFLVAADGWLSLACVVD